MLQANASMIALSLQSITFKGQDFCSAARTRNAAGARLYFEALAQDALEVLCVRGSSRQGQPTGQPYGRHACVGPLSAERMLCAKGLAQEACCFLQQRAVMLHPLLPADAAHHIQRCRRGEPR